MLEIPGDPGGRQVVNLMVGGRVKVGKRERKENSGTGGHKEGPVRARVTSVTGEAVINRENGDKIPAPVRESAVNTQGSPVFAGIAQGIANSGVDDFNNLRETPLKKSGVISVSNELDAGIGEPARRVKSAGTSLETARRGRGIRVDSGFFTRRQGETRRRRERADGREGGIRSMREISVGAIVIGREGRRGFFIGYFVRSRRKMRAEPEGHTGRILTKVGFDEVKARRRAASDGLVSDKGLP